MSENKKSISKSEFEAFIDLLKNKDERTWIKLNFVLKRIIFKWMNKKNIKTEHANEIFGMTMMVFLEKFHDLTFMDFTSMKSYVFSIADKKIKEYFRDSKKYSNYSFNEDYSPSAYIQMMNSNNENNESDLLHLEKNCLKYLSKVEQRLILLLLKEDMTMKEAALELGLSEGNTRVIKHRAVEKLKKKVLQLKIN